LFKLVNKRREIRRRGQEDPFGSWRKDELNIFFMFPKA